MTASFIETLETAICDRLFAVADLNRFKVEPWPEKSGVYKLRAPHGAILVTYKGSTYGRSVTTDYIGQDRTMEFEITTLCRNLRDHRGGYSALEAIRKSLTGWFAPGAENRAYLTKEGFVGEDDGVWEFASYVSIPTFSIQDSDDGANPDEIPIANLTKVTYLPGA